MLPSGRIKELPEDERPREKLERLGAASLTEAELLAIFLRTGIPGKSAIGVARDVLAASGGLTGLATCSVKDLMSSAKGIGIAKACELSAIFEVGKRLARGAALQPRLDTPEAVYNLVAPDLQGLDREQLHILLVNTKYRLIERKLVSVGSLNESIAHPREILKPAITHSAFGFILVHNHPSGDPAPSEADRRLTRRIADGASLLQIQLLDHVIAGNADGGKTPYFSFREHGLL